MLIHFLHESTVNIVRIRAPFLNVLSLDLYMFDLFLFQRVI